MKEITYKTQTCLLPSYCSLVNTQPRSQGNVFATSRSSFSEREGPGTEVGKHNPPIHPPISFNGTCVTRADEHKHLGLILDSKLFFHSHVNEKITKTKKTIDAGKTTP